MSLKNKIYSGLDEMSRHISVGKFCYDMYSRDIHNQFALMKGQPAFIDDPPAFKYEAGSNLLLRLVGPMAIGAIAAGPTGIAVVLGLSFLETLVESGVALGAIQYKLHRKYDKQIQQRQSVAVR